MANGLWQFIRGSMISSTENKRGFRLLLYSIKYAVNLQNKRLVFQYHQHSRSEFRLPRSPQTLKKPEFDGSFVANNQ